MATSSAMASTITSTDGKCGPVYVKLTDTIKVKELFQGLELVTGEQTKCTESIIEEEIPVEQLVAVNYTVSDVLCCSVCQVNFTDKTEQRFHYKSDWHRFNLKQQLKSLPSVTEDDFEKLAENDGLSSLSGSDSEEESVREISSSPVVANGDSDDDEPSAIEVYLRRQQKVYFRNFEGELLAVHRCVLQGKKDQACDLLKVAHSIPENVYWAFFLVGGGHFAGGIFNNAEVVQHKTFHRYTVRAKRGTAQSSRDNQGGNAPKSAGASLRRYNETALTQDISDLIGSWSEELVKCTRIFIRAPSNNKSIFFGGKSSPLDRKDSRVRFIPFPTRRPTFNELKRIHDILTSVTCYGKVSNIEEVILSPAKTQKKAPPADKTKEQKSSDSVLPDITPNENDVTVNLFSVHELHNFSRDLQEFDATKKPRNKKKKKKPATKKDDVKIEKNEENDHRNDDDDGDDDEVALISDELRDQLYTACKTGNIELFLVTVEKTNDKILLETPGVQNSNEALVLALNKPRYGSVKDTLLHVAVRNGQCDIVTALLESGADPTVRNSQGHPAYVVADGKQVRNEMRRFMARNPDRYDYRLAQIPAPLSDEQEAERKAKEAERRKINKKAKKERLKEEREINAEKLAEEAEKQRFVKLSDREKRALAAEKRFSQQVQTQTGLTPVLSRCFTCGSDITGQVPFEYHDYRFCTTKCLKSHRQNANSNKT